MRALLAACVLVTLAGCQTVSGWWDDWFGAASPKEKPAALAEIRNVLPVAVAARADVGGAGPFSFRPALMGDTVYAANHDGRITRLSLAGLRENGRTDTRLKLSGGVGAGNGVVVVGTPKGEVLAFDATGQPRWQARVTSEVMSAPVVAGDVVLVRSADSRIFALNAADGSRKWMYQRATPALTLRSFAGLIVDRNGVFAGFGGGKLVAIDINTGAVGWEASVALPRGVSELERIADVTSNPQLDGGTICAVAYQGRVACFEVQSGNLIWARDMSSIAGLALDARYVYVVDVKGTVHALDKARGAYLWKQEKLANRQLSTPIVHRGHVVVGDLQGYVHFISREDGSFAARVATDGSPIRVAPLVTPEGVLVQTLKGGLFLINVN